MAPPAPPAFYVVQRLDHSQVGEFREDSRGGLRADARPTRIGIFEYSTPSGDVWRELRPAEEVFKADSLSTLAGCPLTVGHPKDPVTPETWRDVSVGHVADDVRQDGNLVAAHVVVQEAGAVSKAKSKSLVELSCGYSCDLDITPGEFEGQRYDAIQRNIVYNHLALLPRGMARGGPQLRLRVDAKNELILDAGLPEAASEEPVKAASQPFGMTLEEALAEIEKLRAKNDSLEAELRSANERNDGADERVALGVQLRLDARTILGADAKLPKTDREIMTEVVKKLDPTFEITDKTTDTYLQARFDSHVSLHKREQTQKLRDRGDGSNAGSEDPVEAARNKMVERNRNSWKDK